MGKSRKANRGWRARMNKALANSPELQAQVTALNVADVTSQLEVVANAQAEMAEHELFLQSELARLQGETVPEPIE